MKAGNHTFASTNKPLGLPLFKRSDYSQKLSSTDGLLALVRAEKHFHQCQCSPHSANTKPGSQSRFM
eukprot:2852138-Amphidinium_carterae.1